MFSYWTGTINSKLYKKLYVTCSVALQNRNNTHNTLVQVTHYVNQHWPQCLTMAERGKRIHPEIAYQPHMQEDEISHWCSHLFKVFRGKEESGVTPTKQHNHRAILPLQSVVRASRTGVNVFHFSKLDKERKMDRSALEMFFQDTHHKDSDWSNDTTAGSGRLNWLDKHRDIRQWQGVTVYGDDCAENRGRVLKLQISKNNICGMFIIF